MFVSKNSIVNAIKKSLGPTIKDRKDLGQIVKKGYTYVRHNMSKGMNLKKAAETAAISLKDEFDLPSDEDEDILVQNTCSRNLTYVTAIFMAVTLGAVAATILGLPKII
ncbi:MAG: hypothetical protein WCI79_00250 [Candidatus Saccharibacteria bacterium]